MFSYTQRAAPSKKKRKRGAGDDQGTLFDIVKAGKGALRVWYCTSFKIVKLEFVLIEQMFRDSRQLDTSVVSRHKNRILVKLGIFINIIQKKLYL